MIVQNSHIAETDDPFRVLFEMREIQLVNYSDNTITASCAENGFNIFIIQHLLQIISSFFVSPAKSKIFLTDGSADFYLIPPLLNFIYCGLYIIQTDITCGRSNTNNISCLKIWRPYTGCCLLLHKDIIIKSRLAKQWMNGKC